MSQPSPDARAVVRATDALTTQVRRIADALTTPVVKYEVRTDDDATTPATTCSARYAGTDPMRWCIRAAHHTGKDHVDETGYHWSDTVAVYPLADGVVKEFIPSPTAGVRLPPMDPVHILGAEAPAADNPPLAACRRMETRTCPPTYNGPCGPRPCARFESDDPTPWEPPPADEDAQRTNRRDSIRNLLARLDRTQLHGDEIDLLRQHVETEIRDADTARRRAEQTEQMRAEAVQVIDMQKELIGTLRSIVMTAITDRESGGVRTQPCGVCEQDHMAELYEAIVDMDKRHAAAFPATADGPARPGRLPEQPTTKE